MITTSDIKELIAALRHPQTCGNARKALVEMGAPAIPLLVGALRDDGISLAAAEVLKMIGAPAVGPLVSALEKKKTSAYAAIVLEDIGEPSVEPLIAALKSKKLRKRILIVRTLGNIGDERAAEPLASVILESIMSDSGGSLLDVTVESLRQLGKFAEERGEISREEFIGELLKHGYEKSPRSNRLYYHPKLADVRFAVEKRIVKLQRRYTSGKRYQWGSRRSFWIKRDFQLALIVMAALSGS